MIRENGVESQRVWQCPKVTQREPRAEDVDALPPLYREALAAVGRMTGATDLHTCPCWYPRVEWVDQAINAYSDYEAGCLADVSGPPSPALIDAVRLLKRSQAAAHAYEMKQRQEEMERRHGR